MDPTRLRTNRIEEFLDLCGMSSTALATRLPNPVLVLEMSPDALRERVVSFATQGVDTNQTKELWAHIGKLREQGKRLRSDGLVRFVFSVKKREGSPFPDRITVGRTQTNDIYLPDERISKLHAYFSVGAGGDYALVDAASRNGTRVNDVELVPHERRLVQSTDRVAFGHHQLGFFAAPAFQRYVAKLVEEPEVSARPS
jgi:hypothetical protein